jgi:hypothetical protein
MEIRHLPVPLPTYPAKPERNSDAASRQNTSSGEKFARAVEATPQALSTGTTAQQTAATLRSQLFQPASSTFQPGQLHNSRLPHSTQNALNTYQDIDRRDEVTAAQEIISRIDTRV